MCLEWRKSDEHRADVQLSTLVHLYQLLTLKHFYSDCPQTLGCSRQLDPAQDLFAARELSSGYREQKEISRTPTQKLWSINYY